MRALKIASIGLLLISAAILLAGNFIFNTHGGARWLLEQATRQANQALSIESVSGTLFDGLELSQIRFTDPEINVEIDHLAVAVNWRKLTSGTLTINELSSRGLSVALSPVEQDPHSFDVSTVRLLRLPIDIVVNSFTALANQIIIGGDRYDVARIAANVYWNQAGLSIDSLEIDHDNTSFSAALSMLANAAAPLGIDLKSNFLGRIGEQATKLSLSIDGPLNDFKFSGRLDSKINALIEGTVKLTSEQVTFKLIADHEPIIVGDEAKPLQLEQGQLLVSGQPRAFQLDYRTQLAHEALGQRDVRVKSAVSTSISSADKLSAEASFQWQSSTEKPSDFPLIEGSGEIHWQNEVLNLSHRLRTPYAINSDIEVSNLFSEPRLTANSSWQVVGPFVVADHTVTSRRGVVSVSGPLDKLTIDTTSALEVGEFPAIEFSANGLASENSIDISSVRLVSSAGDIAGAAKLNWQGLGGLQFSAVAQDINLAAFGLEAETAIGFRSFGNLTDISEALTGEIAIADLNGSWRQHTLLGRADLKLKGSEIELHQGEFRLGENQVTLSGKYAQQMVGDIVVDLKNLSDFDQRLAGSVAGKGKISGEITSPSIAAQLVGKQLVAGNFSSNAFSVALDGDLARPEAPLRADLDIRQLSVADHTFDSVALALTGTVGQHRLQLSLSDKDHSATMSATGSLIEQIWRGEVSALNFNQAQFGQWQLSNPIDVAIDSTAKVSTSKGCIVQQTAKVCFSANNANSVAGNIELAVAAVPLSLFNAYLPADNEMQGYLNGRIEITGGQENLNASGTIDISHGAIHTAISDSDRRDFLIKKFIAKFKSNKSETQFELLSDITDLLVINTDGVVPHAANGKFAVDGNILVPDMRWLESFAPQFAGSSGQLNGSFGLTGRREHPRLKANFGLENGAIQFAEAGFVVDEASLGITSQPGTGDKKSINLSGVVGSPSGNLNLQGNVQFTNLDNVEVALNLSGENFAVARLPNVEIDLSPELLISGNKHGMLVTGEINVTKFNYLVTELPKGTVTVSTDQILLDKNDEPVQRQETTQSAFMKLLSANVNVILGDDVTLSGLGVDTTLSGSIRLTRDPKIHETIAGIGQGTVRMAGGNFDAYGKKLDIEKGVFVFAGPLDNPNIDLRAIRPGIPIIAGIQARGPAKNPKISLFSDPSLGDADILSYIMTGRALDDASSSEAELVTEAAFAFGLEQASVITNGVRDLFGLDSFGLAGSDAESVALSAGKRLSPKLSLRSQLDVFDQLWSFFLRYDLSSNWSIEAESGRRQGGDILYSIEREELFGKD